MHTVLLIFYDYFFPEDAYPVQNSDLYTHNGKDILFLKQTLFLLAPIQPNHLHNAHMFFTLH